MCGQNSLKRLCAKVHACRVCVYLCVNECLYISACMCESVWVCKDGQAVVWVSLHSIAQMNHAELQRGKKSTK